MATVLIVEDEPDVLKVIKARVESKGHQVITAVNGAKALEILQSGNPDLIITDVLMPEMDGFQLYKELKQNPKTKKIPVLVLTARGKMEDTFRVMGVDEFIPKPFDTDVFMNKVNKLLESRAKPEFIPSSAPSIKNNVQILLTGPNQDAVNAILQALSKINYKTEAVSVGTEIFAKAKALHPQLILLDILMEDMPADGIIRGLRNLPEFQKTPILLYSYFSAQAGDDVQQKIMSIDNAKELCLDVGATEYIGNFDERKFAAAISRFLKP